MRSAADLLEEDRDLHRGDALKRVDDPLRLLHVGARLVEHRPGDLGPEQAAVDLGVHPRDAQALEADLREGARLVALQRHPARIGAGGDERGAEAERRLGGVLVAEATGIGEQRRVEVRRDVAVIGAPSAPSNSWTTCPVALADASTRLIEPNAVLLR